MIEHSAGKRFRVAINKEKPLQIVGAVNAYCALMAARAGYRALYLSGAGVANASHGFPDLGMTNLHDVLEDARRITDVTQVPLLVDIDTGWGSIFTIGRTVQQMIKAGVAAVHIEDQIDSKRCGHRPNKVLTPPLEMVDRIKAAVDARTDSDFVIMARTDAFHVEGFNGALERACRYVEAGADAIFPEALTELSQYADFVHRLKVPVLANLTEFGKTPLFTVDELRSVGVSMALYPLTAFRAMSAAAEKAYQQLRQDGTQKNIIEQLQTRDALYDYLDYYAYEAKLDNETHLAPK